MSDSPPKLTFWMLFGLSLGLSLLMTAMTEAWKRHNQAKDCQNPTAQ